MGIPERLRSFTSPIPVLDHGYVMLIDVMGDDDAVVQAARVSYAKGVGARKVSQDRHLLRYLFRHGHTSPFEQCVLKLEVKLPIFVERQWVRHRTGRHNEMSARYSQLPGDFYLPRLEDLGSQSRENKQGRGGALADDVRAQAREDLRASYERSYAAYERALSQGISREVARLHLPVSIYTAKVWQMDLHNLFHFLALRLDPHAQWEIRAYAQVLSDIVRAWVPWSWGAFEDYRLGAMSFTRAEIQALRHLLSQGQVDLDETLQADVQGRERQELLTKLRGLLATR